MTALAMDDLTDDQLVALTRTNLDAWGVLFARYMLPATKLAGYYGAESDANDVASAAFEGVLAAILKGKGPTTSFRSYLFVAVQREMGRRAKVRRRVIAMADVPSSTVVVETFTRDTSGVREAFESLMPRHQQVLLQTVVNEQKPRELAEEMGLSPNAVSALSYRAKTLLRAAYEAEPETAELVEGVL